MEKNLEFSFLLDFYCKMLTDKQREVMQLYYNNDFSLAEIAQHQKITRQGVRYIIKRSEAVLCELEAQLGLAKRFYDLSSGLEEILQIAGKIKTHNDEFIFSPHIGSYVRQIEQVVQGLSE